MKVTVDQDTCIGCGMCIATEPDVFRFNEDGKSEVYGEMTEENKDNVVAAAEGCPVGAIEVTL